MSLIGNTELLCTQCSGFGLNFHRAGCLMGFLELHQEPGAYSRVRAGMAVRNSTWFSEVRIPVQLGRTPQEAKLGLAG